jgi:hypothetical protein
MTNFQEFRCLFYKGESEKGAPLYSAGRITIDLNTVVAFNPFTKDGHTVLRCIDGQSYIVRCEYEEMKDRIESFAVRFEN